MNTNYLADYHQFSRGGRIETSLPVSFFLKYSSSIFDCRNKSLASIPGSGERKVIIIDQAVQEIYGEMISSYFDDNKLDVVQLRILCTEEEKNIHTVEKILRFFEKNTVLRRETIICIGGGILLDIAGYACSIYRRGIPYVKVPTTLLSIVDASVGSKVGINHFGRRNRLGAYYPPIGTLIDKNFIKTEKEQNIVNGLGEIFKLSLIKSRELFDLLQNNSSLLLREKFQYGAVPVRVINLAISEMVSELEPNLWEKDLKRCVDFGHTFSPVPEMLYSQSLLHGEAVALDCLFSSCIAFNRSIFCNDTLHRIFSVARSLKLKTFHESFADTNLLIKSLEDATTHRNGNQNLPLPSTIGDHIFVNDITESDIVNAQTTMVKYHESE